MKADPLDMVCSRSNVREFNAALREHLPELAALAKELHARGLISGLAGAQIAGVDVADRRDAQTARVRAVPQPSAASVQAGLDAWYEEARRAVRRR